MGIDLGKLVDVGSLAHAAADAILPKDMEWMGGLLGAAVDLQCGNPIGALKEGLDVFHDLKDVSLSSSQKQPPSTLPGGWTYEPSPPPPTGWRSQSEPLRATPPVGTTTTVTATVTATATATATVSTAAAPRRDPMKVGQDILFGQGRIIGTIDPSKMTKAQFMAQGNEAFMKAVRDGKIPQEISDSPAAMQALQARMNQISEMNQLMTSMIQAMHQMQMAVIQNVRV